LPPPLLGWPALSLGSPELRFRLGHADNDTVMPAAGST
jgi:hypothetical protein